MRHRQTKRKNDIHWLALISGVFTAGLDDDDDELPPLLLLPEDELLARGSLDELELLALGSARGSFDEDELLARGSLGELEELLARGSLDELDDPDDPERCAAAAAAARGSLRGSGGMLGGDENAGG